MAGAGQSPAGPSRGAAAYWKTIIQSARRRGKNYLKLRVWLMGLIHLFLFALVYWTAFLLRFDFAIPADGMKVLWATLPCVLGIKFFVFLFAGQHDGSVTEKKSNEPPGAARSEAASGDQRDVVGCGVPAVNM